jgi:hypothetical protein
MKTEIARGWGLRVDGTVPYLAYRMGMRKHDIECTQTYHRPVRVVLLPLAEYRRLKRIEKENEK